jgi:TonB family protein
MDNLLLYLLKVSAGTTLFYLCYLLFFRKDTFYLRNRIFLILTLLLPVFIPALKIPVRPDAVVTPEPLAFMENMIYPVTSTEQALIASTSPFDYNRILALLYFTVAGLLLLRGAISLLSTFRIIKKGDLRRNNFPKVVVTEARIPPFSFFPYAVIPAKEFNNEDTSNILEHEFAHIRQGHTFDLLLSEIFIAFQWFNPLVWFIKRSVILNHEYLADYISLLNNKGTREYQYRLLNLNPELKNVSLAHNFNSLIKNRIIMINRKPTRKFAALKNFLILPVAVSVAYAFATPEYRYSDPVSGDNTININQPDKILQKEIKGIVLKEDGKPLEGVSIVSTGTFGNIIHATTGSDGRFEIKNLQDDSFLILNYRGYASAIIKPDYVSEMTIRMSKDNSDKESDYMIEPLKGSSQKPLTVLDGVISDQPASELISKLGNEFGTVVVLKGKEATDKYGDAGKNGVEEVYSRKKATELGIKFLYRRISPDEFPTFQGKNFTTFQDWVISQIRYPEEATAKGIKGRINAGYTIESDGSVTNVKVNGNPDPLLADAVIKAIYSSPKWDPALKPEARVPFVNGMDLKFELPDKIMKDDVFVVVEKMPMYPGGDTEMLKYINNTAKYPEAAKTDKAEGRVIVRFMVNTQGTAEEISVLRGVHPLLDQEAVRVVSTLSGFEPGTQGGKPVNVWYMVPVNFTLPKTEIDQAQPISIKSEEGKRPLIVVDNMITDLDVGNIGIDSKDILSVTVMKDKAATDKYGERAKDGVIEIITKKGDNN